jgi:hypothetical protein
MGIMIGCPHRLHGSVESGGKSPGIKTFASHPGQVTIFKLPLVLIVRCRWLAKAAPGSPFKPVATSHVLAVLSRPVKDQAPEIHAFFWGDEARQ